MRGAYFNRRAQSSALRFSSQVPEKDVVGHWFELRAAVEIGAAACAALAHSAEDLDAIESALLSIDQAIERGDSGGASDVEFHFAIAKATHNPYFIDLLEFLQTRLTEMINTSWRNSSSTGHGPYPAQLEHKKMFAAITARDAPAARRATRSHLLNAAARLGLKNITI
jgi:GntR family transcriptional repressor for pyruvate dehydrogenase complex